ncbi:MAG: barstar family protein [Clostridia bacterium]|nr:barstar family protein [Clostridia bacterium]MBQ2707585.1 barstar family protein [Clostridia bacterium]
MTALQKQTVKVYLINFAGCTTRTGFYARLARTFGLSAAIAFNGKAWETLCQRVAMLARSGYSVRVHLHDLDTIYPTMKTECENLLRILRAAGESGDDFRAEAVIGSAKWRI